MTSEIVLHAMPLCACFSSATTDAPADATHSITSVGKKRSTTTSRSNAIALANVLSTRCLAAINVVASSDTQLVDYLVNCKALLYINNEHSIKQLHNKTGAALLMYLHPNAQPPHASPPLVLTFRGNEGLLPSLLHATVQPHELAQGLQRRIVQALSGSGSRQATQVQSTVRAVLYDVGKTRLPYTRGTGSIVASDVAADHALYGVQSTAVDILQGRAGMPHEVDLSGLHAQLCGLMGAQHNRAQSEGLEGAGTQGTGTQEAGTQGTGTQEAGTQGTGTQGTGTQGAGNVDVVEDNTAKPEVAEEPATLQVPTANGATQGPDDEHAPATELADTTQDMPQSTAQDMPQGTGGEDDGDDDPEPSVFATAAGGAADPTDVDSKPSTQTSLPMPSRRVGQKGGIIHQLRMDAAASGSLDAGGSLPAPQPQTSGPRPRRRWVAAGNANKDTASIHHVSESSSDALLEANSPKALLGDVRVPSDAGMMLHGRPTQAAGAQPPAALPCLAEVEDPSLHSLGATSSTSLEPLPSSNPSQPASLVGSTHPSTHLSSQSSPHYLPAMRKGMPLDDDFDAMLNTLAVQDAHMERAADADTEEKSTTKTNSHPRAVVKPRQRVDASTAPHAAADSNGKGSTRVVDGRVLVQLVPVESSGTVACSLKLGKRAPQQGGGRARGGGSAGRGRGMQGRRASGPPVRTASAVNRFGGADHEDEEGPAPLAAITGPLKRFFQNAFKDEYVAPPMPSPPPRAGYAPPPRAARPQPAVPLEQRDRAVTAAEKKTAETA